MRKLKGTEALSLLERPYHAENTGSGPITEVKHHRARRSVILLMRKLKGTEALSLLERPYHAENTGSGPITEVKHHRARDISMQKNTTKVKVLESKKVRPLGMDRSSFSPSTPYHAETPVLVRSPKLSIIRRSVLGRVTTWEHRVPLAF
ncbi:hypothetical protein NPIL_343571 [Nephila pilipes]|uniref:Uncharacterized protein n=1 Tax=Nephila pilipes TaxID=299642 RepID=A0A8X6MU96_NEPPI|nr:hypothetical protein NPIL_343571 [Nephila pilipes]